MYVGYAYIYVFTNFPLLIYEHNMLRVQKLDLFSHLEKRKWPTNWRWVGKKGFEQGN